MDDLRPYYGHKPGVDTLVAGVLVCGGLPPASKRGQRASGFRGYQPLSLGLVATLLPKPSLAVGQAHQRSPGTWSFRTEGLPGAAFPFIQRV